MKILEKMKPKLRGKSNSMSYLIRQLILAIFLVIPLLSISQEVDSQVQLSCCDSDHLKQLLEENDFHIIYEILPEEPQFRSENSSANRSSTNIINHIEFNDFGQFNDLSSQIESYLTPNSISTLGFLTDNPAFCINDDLEFQTVLDEFNSASEEIVIWRHIWKDPVTGDRVLFEKINDYPQFLSLKYPFPQEIDEDLAYPDGCGKPTPEERIMLDQMAPFSQVCFFEEYRELLGNNDDLIFHAKTISRPADVINGTPQEVSHIDIVRGNSSAVFQVYEDDVFAIGAIAQGEVSDWIYHWSQYCSLNSQTDFHIYGTHIQFPYEPANPFVFFAYDDDDPEFELKRMHAWRDTDGVILYREAGTEQPQEQTLTASEFAKLQADFRERLALEGLSFPPPIPDEDDDDDEEEEWTWEGLDLALKSFMHENPTAETLIRAAAGATAITIGIAVVAQILSTSGISGIVSSRAAWFIARRLLRIAAGA